MSRVQNNLRINLLYGSRANIDEGARLPKTMPHWFSDYGINFELDSGTGYGRRKNLLQGCGSPVRYFRALPHLGLLQICDGYFDRWANSVGAETTLPKTRAEFKVALDYLLSVGKIAPIDPEKEIASLVENLDFIDVRIEETQLNHADLEAHVRHFGRSKRWIARLWTRYQRELALLRAKRMQIIKDIGFQKRRSLLK